MQIWTAGKEFQCLFQNLVCFANKISSQILLPSGSMGHHKYVLQLLISKKITRNSTTTKAWEKITTNLESLEF
jgi:hypothetical protein